MTREISGLFHVVSAQVRFFGFNVVGVKIAIMATNILARDFKVPMQDLNCVDVSPDVQVRRVLTRLC